MSKMLTRNRFRTSRLTSEQNLETKLKEQLESQCFDTLSRTSQMGYVCGTILDYVDPQAAQKVKSMIRFSPNSQMTKKMRLMGSRNLRASGGDVPPDIQDYLTNLLSPCLEEFAGRCEGSADIMDVLSEFNTSRSARSEILSSTSGIRQSISQLKQKTKSHSRKRVNTLAAGDVSDIVDEMVDMNTQTIQTFRYAAELARQVNSLILVQSNVNLRGWWDTVKDIGSTVLSGIQTVAEYVPLVMSFI